MCNIAQWILKKQSRCQVLQTRQKWCTVFLILCKYQLVSFSLLFFQSLGTLSPYSQVSTGPSAPPPVHSRTLKTGWDLLTRVFSSCHWDVRLHVHFHLFVSSGLWQPGHKAEALLQSRLHWLPHIQPSGHVSHHAALSAALRLPWWVSRHRNFILDHQKGGGVLAVLHSAL